MFRRIQQRGVRRLVIGALGDLASAATDPQRLHDYLYALVQHFAVSTITSVLNFETMGNSLSGNSMLERCELPVRQRPAAHGGR